MYKSLLRKAMIWECTVKDTMEAFASRDARKVSFADILSLESSFMGGMKTLSTRPDAWRIFNGVGINARKYAMELSNGSRIQK